MSGHSTNSRPEGTRRPLRAGALALTALMLVTACATGAPMGGGRAASRHHAAGPGESFFTTLPTDFAPVRVSDSELAEGLTTLWLDMPLRVAMSRAGVEAGRRLTCASEPPGGEAWRSDLARSYERFCERCGTPGDCLSLFEDGPRLRDEDKRSIALALAVTPALEGVDAELRAMLDPTRVLAMLSVTIVVYMGLLLAPVPEPVTKGLALLFSVLLWGYLGWEFFDVMRAYARLHEEAPRASTFAELREVGERFGGVIGPNSVRILVLVGTAAVGNTVSLASKAPKLPGFGQASRAVEANTGLRLLDAATGAERVIVSVPEGALHAVLAPHVVAMAGRTGGGDGNSSSVAGVTPAGGMSLHRAFKSFDAFKKDMGPAGEDKVWHHIVEQRRVNVERFGPEVIHNTENLIAINKAEHDAISAFYSTKSRDAGGMVVREWLRTKSYEEQRAFGLMILRRFGVIP